MKPYQLLEIWGLSVIIGWLVTRQLFQVTYIILSWIIIMSVPSFLSYLWLRRFPHSFYAGVKKKNPFFLIASLWIAVSIFGSIFNYYYDKNLIITYLASWSVIAFIGFLVTAYLVPDDWAKYIYVPFAIFNLVYGIFIIYNPSMLEYVYIIFAVLQGVPVLMHGLLRGRLKHVRRNFA